MHLSTDSLWNLRGLLRRCSRSQWCLSCGLWIYWNNPPLFFFLFTFILNSLCERKTSGVSPQIYFPAFIKVSLVRMWLFTGCEILGSQEKFISPFGLCLKLHLTLQGIWLQMKHSCWHQNWQVRNICALSVSWQIGHRRDRGIDYSDMWPGAESPAEINSSLSCFVMAEWRDGGYTDG